MKQVAASIEPEPIYHSDWLIVENGTVRRMRTSDFSDPDLVYPDVKWNIQISAPTTDELAGKRRD